MQKFFSCMYDPSLLDEREEVKAMRLWSDWNAGLRSWASSKVEEVLLFSFHFNKISIAIIVLKYLSHIVNCIKFSNFPLFFSKLKIDYCPPIYEIFSFWWGSPVQISLYHERNSLIAHLVSCNQNWLFVKSYKTKMFPMMSEILYLLINIQISAVNFALPSLAILISLISIYRHFLPQLNPLITLFYMKLFVPGSTLQIRLILVNLLAITLCIQKICYTRMLLSDTQLLLI